MNDTDYFASRKTRGAEPEVLDADMRPSDIADILRRLKFDVDDEWCLIGLDRPVRDYSVRMLTAARRK